MTNWNSPKKISLYASLVVSLVPGLLVLVSGAQWFVVALALILTFLTAFFTFNFYLEKFIYRKIKVIYKNIHRLKTEHLNNEEEVLDPLTEVQNEVFAWAKERRDEIALLKKQETFRREFIGNISHELKTPIFNIQGYIHTLLDGALNDPAVNKRFLEKAAKGADRMAELVQGLTSINNLESGSANLNLVTFNIRDLIDEVYDSLEFQAQKAKVKLGLKAGSEKAGMVYADKSQIKQVLTNLLVNAIKYGNSGNIVNCGIYDMHENYLIEVSDNGDGIPQEHLPRLFERFYRVDRGRSREKGGSGLGLAIVKHIVESHGQSISVRSKVGSGTTFGFTLEKSIR